MRINPAEIIDRMSIVKLKIERIKHPKLNEEMIALEKALEEFRIEGVRIDKRWLKELYEINKIVWDLLDEVNEKRRKKDLDYEEMGKLYSKIEDMNKERAIAKNKIIEKTGKGFREIRKR